MPISFAPTVDKRRAVSGAYYDQGCGGIDGFGTFSNTAVTLTANRIITTEHLLLPGSYDKLAFFLGTASAAGKLIRLMLYDFDPATGNPGALLRDASTTLAADASTGVVYEVAMTSDLVITTPTRIVSAIWSDGAPVVSGWVTLVRGTWGRTSASSGRRGIAYRDLTFGAAPNPFGSVDGYLTANFPELMVKAK